MLLIAFYRGSRIKLWLYKVNVSIPDVDENAEQVPSSSFADGELALEGGAAGRGLSGWWRHGHVSQ